MHVQRTCSIKVSIQKSSKERQQAILKELDLKNLLINSIPRLLNLILLNLIVSGPRAQPL